VRRQSVCEKSYPSRARKEAVRYPQRKTAPSRSRLGFSSRFSYTLCETDSIYPDPKE